MVFGVVSIGADEWRRRLGVAMEMRPTIGVRPDEAEKGSEKRTLLFVPLLGVLVGIAGDDGRSGIGSALILQRRARLTAIGRLMSSMMIQLTMSTTNTQY
jgi:hypothetical protein